LADLVEKPQRAQGRGKSGWKLSALPTVMMLSLIALPFTEGERDGASYGCTSATTASVAIDSCIQQGNDRQCAVKVGITAALPFTGAAACYDIYTVDFKNVKKPLGTIKVIYEDIQVEYTYNHKWPTSAFFNMAYSFGSCYGGSGPAGTSEWRRPIYPNEDPQGRFFAKDSRLITNPHQASSHPFDGCGGRGGCFFCSPYLGWTYDDFSFITFGDRYDVYFVGAHKLSVGLRVIFMDDQGEREIFSGSGVYGQVIHGDGFDIRLIDISTPATFPTPSTYLLRGKNSTVTKNAFGVITSGAGGNPTGPDVIWHVNEGDVPVSGTPAKGNLGDIQFAVPELPLDRAFAFDPTQCTWVDNGDGTDSAICMDSFLPNGAHLYDVMGEKPYNGYLWYPTALNQDGLTIKTDTSFSTAIALNLVSTTDLTFVETNTEVCPVYTDTTPVQLGGVYDGPEGASILLTGLSSDPTCAPGTAIISINPPVPGLTLLTGEVFVAKDYNVTNVKRVQFVSTLKEVLNFTLLIIGSGGNVSIPVHGVVLNPSATHFNTTKSYTSGVVLTDTSGGPPNLNLDIGSPLSGFGSFLDKFGLGSLWNGSIGDKIASIFIMLIGALFGILIAFILFRVIVGVATKRWSFHPREAFTIGTAASSNAPKYTLMQ